jgi:hypothetical protein
VVIIMIWYGYTSIKKSDVTIADYQDCDMRWPMYRKTCRSSVMNCNIVSVINKTFYFIVSDFVWTVLFEQIILIEVLYSD